MLLSLVCEPSESSVQHMRRKAIVQIMKSDLSQTEKDLAIQALHYKCPEVDPTPAPLRIRQDSDYDMNVDEMAPTYHDEAQGILGCQHYPRSVPSAVESFLPVAFAMMKQATTRWIDTPQ